MMSLHSSRASRSETFAGNLYESSVRTAPRGEFEGAGGIIRTSLERISPCTRFELVTREGDQLKKHGGGIPIDGPPRTRMISLDEPPSSETGSTKHASSNAEQMAFPPEPPDITVILGDDSGVSVINWALVLGRMSELLLRTGCGLGFAGWTGRSNTEELGLSSRRLPCIPGLSSAWSMYLFALLSDCGDR